MALTDKQKLNIITKYNMNWTIIKIAEDMKINKATVHLWIKRYKLTKSLARKVGTGIKIIDTNRIG